MLWCSNGAGSGVMQQPCSHPMRAVRVSRPRRAAGAHANMPKQRERDSSVQPDADSTRVWPRCGSRGRRS